MQYQTSDLAEILNLRFLVFQLLLLSSVCSLLCSILSSILLSSIIQYVDSEQKIIIQSFIKIKGTKKYIKLPKLLLNFYQTWGQVVNCNCSILWSYIKSICWKSWLTRRRQLCVSSCYPKYKPIMFYSLISWRANLKHSWLKFAVIPFPVADSMTRCLNWSMFYRSVIANKPVESSYK